MLSKYYRQSKHSPFWPKGIVIVITVVILWHSFNMDHVCNLSIFQDMRQKYRESHNGSKLIVLWNHQEEDRLYNEDVNFFRLHIRLLQGLFDDIEDDSFRLFSTSSHGPVGDGCVRTERLENTWRPCRGLTRSRTFQNPLHVPGKSRRPGRMRRRVRKNRSERQIPR